MNEMRDRLIELCDTNCGYVDEIPAENFADYLLANGVTVQKWISVKDRLPKKNREAVLIALHWEQTDIGWYNKENRCWQSEFINSYDDGEVTHWMPLPKPPKGETK